MCRPLKREQARRERESGLRDVHSCTADSVVEIGRKCRSWIKRIVNSYCWRFLFYCAIVNKAIGIADSPPQMHNMLPAIRRQSQQSGSADEYFGSLVIFMCILFLYTKLNLYVFVCVCVSLFLMHGHIFSGSRANFKFDMWHPYIPSRGLVKDGHGNLGIGHIAALMRGNAALIMWRRGFPLDYRHIKTRSLQYFATVLKAN